ncbi:UNKNOWN [Stylonychia lemnae]|uniref:Uncharacterized protein n=1 Tax=Stylonychia lemnae TaxID=5949 RepID=A0A078AW70_STYLE|nr:UNKNOWN [Stylonychia lemnae]|eukprot:CDW85043.1 UNKNOWN [Stylonychia lemnae]
MSKESSDILMKNDESLEDTMNRSTNSIRQTIERKPTHISNYSLDHLYNQGISKHNLNHSLASTHTHLNSNINLNDTLSNRNVKQDDLSTLIFYDNIKENFNNTSTNETNLNETVISYNGMIKQVIKDQDVKKKNFQYHFETDNNPKRYLALKTKRKKDQIAVDKDFLDQSSRTKAKELLEKTLIDNRYIMEQESFEKLSRLEQELYYSESLYLIKQPEYIERVSCGLLMAQNNYKVIKKLTLDAIQSNRTKSIQNHILEFRENSNQCERCCLLSGMKRYQYQISSPISPEIDGIFTKNKVSCSPFFGGNSFAEISIRIDSSMKQEWRNLLNQNIQQMKRIQENNARVKQYEQADVQYNVNINQAIDPQIIMKQVMNVEGLYQGYLELNKWPFYRGELLLGPKDKEPKYAISFPSSSNVSLLGSLYGNLNMQIIDVRYQNRCVGLIRKQKIDILTDLCSNATVYYIEFPRSSSPMDKILIICGVQMIDQTFYNKRMPVGSCKGLMCCLIPPCF